LEELGRLWQSNEIDKFTMVAVQPEGARRRFVRLADSPAWSYLSTLPVEASPKPEAAKPPHPQEALFLQANAHLDTKEYEQAAVACSQAIDLSRDIAACYILRARAYHRLSR